MKKLQRESTVQDVFNYINCVEENPTCVILFVDQSVLCNTYGTQAWLKQEDVQIVEVDQEILETLQIGKVPQFRFYVNGTEVHEVIGTVDHNKFLERKQQLFVSSVLKISSFKQPAPVKPVVEL